MVKELFIFRMVMSMMVILKIILCTGKEPTIGKRNLWILIGIQANFIKELFREKELFILLMEIFIRDNSKKPSFMGMELFIKKILCPKLVFGIREILLKNEIIINHYFFFIFIKFINFFFFLITINIISPKSKIILKLFLLLFVFETILNK